MAERVIIDCDPGHDDAVAIMLAGGHPSIELLGITTVAGNQTVEKTTANALKLVEYLGLDVPVAKGASQPLLIPRVVSESIHGKSGMDGAALPAPTRQADSRSALELIASLLEESSEQVNLVAMGPLTNVALSLHTLPDRLRGKIKRIVLMGGSIGLGNATPAAEFNIMADPEAAAMVFRSEIPLTMMGLDITLTALATRAVRSKIRAIGNPAAELFDRMMAHCFAVQEKIYHWKDGAPQHDPTTIAWLIDPRVVETKHVHVQVDTSGGPCNGRTLCDMFGVTKKTPNCEVGVKLDFDGFWRLVEEAIAHYPGAGSQSEGLSHGEVKTV